MPEFVSTPPNQSGMVAKDELVSLKNVSVVVCDCVNRIRLWPVGRDDRSGVLIGAGGKRPSDWPERV